MFIWNCFTNIFTAYNNKFNFINIANNHFNQVDFPHGQIDIKSTKVINEEKELENLKNKFLYLDFTDKYNNKNTNKEKLKSANETFRFLLANSDYYLNKKEQTRLKYLELLSSINNPLKRTLYRIFGGLMMPERILLIIIGTIFAFSLLHAFPGNTFNVLGIDGNTSRRALSFT
jgi:hypothetical protein